MSKHTPGPWRYTTKLRGSENHNGFSIYNAYWRGLADVRPADQNGTEGEANARLIAAAPDLYDLALNIARLNPDAGGLSAGMLEQMVAEARAAIAKATGGA